ncbi:methyltransferase domain-containing protein [Streptomyces albidochromogenes]|uniref:Protein-L-isoaspartate O-methyltransferase n=1 Tax=Streptomyces albidochromogenes TaxID=329524 RepID=A0ABW6FDV6_9ACTN
MGAPTLSPAQLVDRLLHDIEETLGRPVPPVYAGALRAVPRHEFLPDRYWVRDGRGGYTLRDRTKDPDGWMTTAYTDTPAVTQFSDAPPDDPAGGSMPSSSASQPSMVITALIDAEPRHGHRILEIGTGTGFNAALLTAHLGAGQVTTVEVDPLLTTTAQQHLNRLDLAPTVLCTDGTLGAPNGAPYDRILATCSVRTVPPAWVQQTATGGRIITPWDSAWSCYGTLTLTKRPDETAQGRFAPYGSYMTIRGQQPDIDLERDILRTGQTPTRSTTTISPWAVAGGNLDTEFHLGLTTPGAWYAWDPATDAAHTRLWIADTTATSWAAIDYDGQQASTFAVSQYGPRHLWDEVETAYRQWTALGQPGVHRYGMTVNPDGTPTPWLDCPGQPLDGLPRT